MKVVASRCRSHNCAEGRLGEFRLGVPAEGFPGPFGGPGEAKRGLQVRKTEESQETACPGSNFPCFLWLSPLLLGYRARGSNVKLHVLPFLRTVPFFEAYSQAMQVAGDTPGCWVRVVHIAEGQRQRLWDPYPVHQIPPSPIFNSSHAP
jgi:hypothetical protein